MRNEIHVFHWAAAPDANDPRDVSFKMGFRPKVEQVRQFVADKQVTFKKVAILKGSSNLDLAYERTNSIHGAWYEDNIGVQVNGEHLLKEVDGGVRSSMCGDILVHVTDEVVRGYMVATFGFDALPSIDLFGIEL